LAENIIIGSGFSAFVTSKILEKNNLANFRIISAEEIQNYAGKVGIKRNRNLEVNKLLSDKGYSYGALGFHVQKMLMHDRLSPGGNTKVWGGFFNRHRSPQFILDLLEEFNAGLVSLGFDKTGSYSNCNGIVQLQDQNKSIFSTNLVTENGYVVRIDKIGKKLYLEIFFSQADKFVIVEASRVIFCLGSYQLIDLLFRSGFLSDADQFTLSERGYKLRLIRDSAPMPETSKCLIIRYTIDAALRHGLGYRSFQKMLVNRGWPGFLIQQEFNRDIQSVTFKILGGVLTGTSPKKFGSSIHYYDLHVNERPINDFLSNIDSKILCIGMPAVANHEPGPISNDIALLAHQSITKLLNYPKQR
jgi:hypothetical protein